MATLTNLTGNETWTLLDEEGSTAVTFTSFIDLDISNEGNALTYPIEEGGFANYNKVASPIEAKVTLAVQGTDADFEDVLSKLDTYKTDAVKLQISTPSFLYESMTLESYSYKREYDSGAGLLTVELSLVEVREVTAQTTQVTVSSGKSSTSSVSTPANATSSANVNTGKTQTTEVTEKSQSKIFKRTGKVSVKK